MVSEPAFERQFPLAWLFEAWPVVRSGVLPAAIFLIFSQGFAIAWFALLLLIPAVLVGVAKYLALSFRVGREELVVRDGILRRNERRIAFGRIQNIDEVRSLLHRLVGAAAIRLESAGGSEPEAVLHLSPEAVQRVRAAVFGADRSEADAEEESARPHDLVAVPVSDLIRLGLIKNRGVLVVAAAFGALSQFDLGFDLAWWERLESWAPALIEAGTDQLDLGWPVLVLLGAALVIAAYLVLSLLSIAIAVVRFHGFRLRRREDELHSRFGLLTLVQKAVPRRRVQRLQVEETLRHRWLRRVSVRLDTAGGTGGSWKGASSVGDLERSAESGRQWLAPVTLPARVPALIAAALPKLSMQPLAESDPDASVVGNGWQPIEQRAAKRLFDRSVLALMIATFVLVWVSPWALGLLILTPLVWWVCRRYVANRHYWLTGDALWWRTGWLGRELTVIPFEKIQSVGMRESPFDRRHRMASVLVDTARSGSFHGAKIDYLDVDDAREIAELLADEAGRREFVWA